MVASDEVADLLFREARSFGAWLDKPVSDETLRRVYDLMKWGPTSANSNPVHISPAVDFPPALCAAWTWSVVQKNAPGAISAMAYTVTPVSVRLRFISTSSTSAITGPFCSVVPSGPPGMHQDFTHRAAPHRPCGRGTSQRLAVPWRT